MTKTRRNLSFPAISNLRELTAEVLTLLTASAAFASVRLCVRSIGKNRSFHTIAAHV
jgi:hypothetical protein